jgi:hypothetical protein
MKLTLEEKVIATIKYANDLIESGWNRGEAIQNSRNLWNLSNKRMMEVESAIPKSRADLWEESNMRANAFIGY